MSPFIDSPRAGVPVYSTYEYALKQRCPRCKAEPGEQCDAPRKNAKLDAQDRRRAAMGLPPREHVPHLRMHVARQDAGSKQYTKDLVAAYNAM